MAKKKIFVFIEHQLGRVGWVNQDDAEQYCAEHNLESLKKVCKQKDVDRLREIFDYFDDNHEYFYEKIYEIRFIEAPVSLDRPYNLLRDMYDDTKDVKDFVKITSQQIPVRNKGLAYKQVTPGTSICAEIVMNKDEKFDPAKLEIPDYHKIVYGGKKYEYICFDGDDNGDYVYYLDGKAINPKTNN